MSEAAEMQITPEEERFLKRFFRRNALPWMALIGFATVAVCWSLLPAEVEDSTVTVDALVELRAENERLRADIVEVKRRMGVDVSKVEHGVSELEARVAKASRNLQSIETRVKAALENRLDEIESRLDTPSGSVAATPEGASNWDVSAILERLYNLEVRRERNDQARETFEKSVLRRLHQVETGAGHAQIPTSPPARVE